MTDSIEWVNASLDFLFAYGPLSVYTAIFLACFVENLFPPFPGDTFILGGGALVAAGRLELIATMTVILTGGLASTMIVYFIGQRFGREFFLRKNYAFFSVKDIHAVEERLSRWGGLVLVTSRFIVGFRSALAAGAGIARYPAGRMFIYSSVSYLIFVSLLIYLSMSLVENFDTISRYFRTYQRIIWPLLALLVTLYIVRRFRLIGSGNGAEQR